MRIDERFIKEGMEKGVLEVKRKITKNFKKLGLPEEQVAEAVEL